MPAGFKSPVSNRHEKIFSEKPCATTVVRASYQDSNIFGVDRVEIKTV